MGDGGQVQGAIGGAASGCDDGGGVFQCLFGDNIPRADVFFQQVHDGAAGFKGELVARFVGCWCARRAGQGQADGFTHAGHGVGGELPAAAAAGGAGGLFEFAEFCVGHVARGVFADALEDVDHRDIPALIRAREDGAAIDEDAGDVEADHGHHHAGE